MAPLFVRRLFDPKRHALWVFISLAALFVLHHLSLFTNWGSSYIGGSRADAGIYVYLESVNASGFFTWPSHGFDIPIFYPWNRALGFSDNFLLPAFIAKILVPIVGSESVVYNLILVAAMVLNGFCAYLLARKITESGPASFFAGYIFMISPYFALRRGHPQLQFGFWIPLAILAAIIFAEKRTWRSATAIGACVAGAFFCSVYYSMYTYFVVGVVLLGCFVLRPGSWRLGDILKLVTANIPWLLLLAPAAIAYRQTRDAMGTNPEYVLRRHSPPLISFIAPPKLGLFWNSYIPDLSSMEGYLFFGYLALLIATITVCSWGASLWRSPDDRLAQRVRKVAFSSAIVAAIYGTIRTYYFSSRPGSRTLHHIAWVQSETFWALTLAALALLWSLGRTRTSERLSTREWLGLLVFVLVVTVFATLGVKDSGKVKTLAPELYRYVAMLPGFEGLRGLARMGLLAILTFILIAATGIAHFLKQRGISSTPKAWGIVGALSLLSAFELRTSRQLPAPAVPPPPIYEFASNLPTSEAVLALPTSSALGNGRHFMIWNSLHMIWMRNAKNRLVNGFSGKAPAFHSFYSQHLDQFPSRKALSLIGSIVGVRYVITNSSFYGLAQTRKIPALVKKLPEEVELLSCDETKSCAYRVRPVIHTSTLPVKELLVPPGQSKRVVSFEVKAEDGAGQAPVTVFFGITIGANKDFPKTSKTLEQPGAWAPFSVEIPENDERVIPTVIDITVEGAPGVMLRNLSVSP